ncbi:hypothetical protein [Streptomyces sp. I05A-00742]|uniref:hypothetical protein n=1 Tax=Streptomyces sp. I05A-00742 TaxID=2732853 RepID=UPI001487BE8E|nr:hypothetical protein [Streptomyces sp. I05A-00742]
MTAEDRPASRTPAARDLRRHHDGSLHDTALHRPVTLAELADGVRAGGSFLARGAATGRDRTYHVLAAVLACEVARASPMTGRGELSLFQAAATRHAPGPLTES